VSGQYCAPSGACVNLSRLQSVTSSFGYQVQFQFKSDSTASPADYYTLAKATAFNLGTDYCDPTATSCSFSQTWPSVTFGAFNGFVPGTVTDAMGRTIVSSRHCDGEFR
jgi:hypothetical protein